MGLEDQAYIHLRSATIRLEIESWENHRIVVAAFPPNSADNERPLLAVYPFQQYGANGQESSGGYGDILGWSTDRINFLGFAVGTNGNQVGAKVVFAIPIWFLVMISVMPLVFLWLFHRRGKRRGALNVCEKCGYDLRATPLRCPECGTPVGAS